MIGAGDGPPVLLGFSQSCRTATGDCARKAAVVAEHAQDVGAHCQFGWVNYTDGDQHPQRAYRLLCSVSSPTPVSTPAEFIKRLGVTSVTTHQTTPWCLAGGAARCFGIDETTRGLEEYLCLHLEYEFMSHCGAMPNERAYQASCFKVTPLLATR